MQKLKKHHLAFLWLFCLVVILIFLKWEHLSLAHFWDEAFPYSYAVGFMTENGPSISPNAAPELYTTGHPLLYYYLQSTWNLWFGNELFVQRLFPLFISIAGLLVIYFVGKKLTDSSLGGIVAALVLISHDVFIAQSSFQLPETLLMLLLLLSIYGYLAKNLLLFLIASSLMIFTKEPAVVLYVVLSVFYLWENRGEGVLKYVLILSAPLLINFGFYVWQYMEKGWFLFPRHTGFMSFDAGFVFNQFKRYFSHLFLYSSRNVEFFALLGISLLLLAKRKKISQNTFMLCALLLGFMFFSSMNFYSNRYILCLSAVFALLYSFGIATVDRAYPNLVKYLFVIPPFVTLIVGFQKNRPVDHSLGYANMVIVQQKAIDYLIENYSNEDDIFTGFLSSKYLTSYYPRYLEEGQVFNGASNQYSANTDLILCASNENETHHMRGNTEFRLVKRFDVGKEWCEIYERLERKPTISTHG